MGLLWLPGMGRIRFLSVAVALLASFAVTGCAAMPPWVCPAIAWFNTFEVNLTGNVDDVASFELCIDGECASSAAVQQATDEPLRLATLDPQELQLSSSAPQAASPQTSAPPFLVTLMRVDADTWRVSMDMAAPETLTLRALSSDGDVLVKQEVALDWRRVGGSEQCGGPSEAGPVSLDIPS